MNKEKVIYDPQVIKENRLVTHEEAVCLKKLGFNGITKGHYRRKFKYQTQLIVGSARRWNELSENHPEERIIAVPTIEQARDFLRTECRYHIQPTPSLNHNSELVWFCHVYDLSKFNKTYNSFMPQVYGPPFKSIEEVDEYGVSEIILKLMRDLINKSDTKQTT